MGRAAFTNTNPHIIYSMNDTLNEKDVLVIISESGKSEDTVLVAMLAKNKHMKVIALTKVGKNPLHELSDVVLKTVNYNSNKRLSALTIRSSHLCLIDVLCMNLVKRDYSYYKNKIDRSSKITNNNLK